MTLPRCAGIGLRAPHVEEMLASRPAVGWLEVHSENYFADGGPALAALLALRADYPVSLHGVGLGLGSSMALDTQHIDRLARLIERVHPAAVSEHICWGAVPGRHLNDLLPLPYTEEALVHLAARIVAVQDRLQRPLLIENVSRYLRFEHEAIPEWEFVATLVQRTGCQLLLDVNNIYVNACNFGFSAQAYLDAMPTASIAEIHLGGHTDTGHCLIDTHGTPVCEAVWQLYAGLIERIGIRPTLIEWDTDLPALAQLLTERERAQSILEARYALAG